MTIPSSLIGINGTGYADPGFALSRYELMDQQQRRELMERIERERRAVRSNMQVAGPGLIGAQQNAYAPEPREPVRALFLLCPLT